MNIGILSGKGGTGKTLLSTNLAVFMKGNYIDCDVEEPNGFIFLNPDEIKSEDVLVDYPIIQKEKCNLCGECIRACEFNAIAKSKEIFVFEKMCHSCGACKIVCPTGALKYEKRKIGSIDEGQSRDIKCIQGIMDIGEAIAVPIIKDVLNNLPQGLNIIDCAPGTSCNVVTSLEYVDKAVLITEPTEFGLHDLKAAIQLCNILDIPFGVVINRTIREDNLVYNYCLDNDIKILGIIPYSKEIAKIYSKGELLIENDDYIHIFKNLEKEIRRL